MLRVKIMSETDDFRDKYSIWKPVAKMEFLYADADDFEFHNDALAYKIAEIVREEIEELKKEKFLRENPELRHGQPVDILIASTPL